MGIVPGRWIIFSLITVLAGYYFNMLIPTQGVYASGKTLPKDVFTLEIKDEPLRKVFNMISKASGYKIRFNSKYGGANISVKLDNVTLQEAITRVLQPYNHVAVWDEKNKEIGLFIFDNKNPPVSITGVNRIFELATETTAGP